MFYVYGVCKKKCRKAAEKKVSALRGKLAPKTQSEYEAKVDEVAKEVFETAKPVCVSAELSTPSSVTQFIELAKKSGQYRDLQAMRKKPVQDSSGKAVRTKAGRMRFECVPVDTRYLNEMSEPCEIF